MRVAVVFVLCFLGLSCAATTFCGQWDSQTSGSYILYNDLWGISGATGSQCTTLTSVSGNTIVWSTKWAWSGGSSGVKSFANAAIQTGLNKKLSAITSIPSVWDWSYATSGSIVGDVAYDIWTSSTSGGSNEYEIMIWLAKYGNAEPISSSYNSSGLPVPITTTTIGGVKYDLYEGNIGWTVLSFVARSTVTAFNADLKLFFNVLTSGNHISSSQYLTKLQAGTEPTSGATSTLTVSKYSVTIN